MKMKTLFAKSFLSLFLPYFLTFLGSSVSYHTGVDFSSYYSKMLFSLCLPLLLSQKSRLDYLPHHPWCPHLNSCPLTLIRQVMKLREFQFIYPWAHKPRSQGTFTPVPFSSVSQLCLTLCYAMDCNMPGFLSIINSQSLLKLMSIKSVMPSNHLILCHPLLLLSSIFPSIRVFSSESALCIKWPKDCTLNSRLISYW